MNAIRNVWILLTFLVIYPLGFLVQFVFLQFRKTYPIAHYVNLALCRICFKIWGIRYECQKSEKIKSNQHYILCPNHASYIDIPIVMLTWEGVYSFIGKSSLTKIPLFGYMFKKLYISVNRKSPKSRANSLKASEDVLKKHQSLVIYPEGGIPNHEHPKLVPFKDGAFKLAIQHKTPIIPVTILNSWKVLPDGKWLIDFNYQLKIIYHDPIPTENLSLSDINDLKTITFATIQNDLTQH